MPTLASLGLNRLDIRDQVGDAYLHHRVSRITTTEYRSPNWHLLRAMCGVDGAVANRDELFDSSSWKRSIVASCDQRKVGRWNLERCGNWASPPGVAAVAGRAV